MASRFQGGSAIGRVCGRLPDVDLAGCELALAYYEQVVAPIIDARWPDLPYAAARLGSGSEVIGLDDDLSRDHDWGLRLNLLVPNGLVVDVDRHLDANLPDEWAGRPTRFAVTWDASVRHRVLVDTAQGLGLGRLGVDATTELSTTDWLSLTGQSVLEVTAGDVFVDCDGALGGIRRRLEWYPDDLWRYVIATDWARIAQELPFVGRSASRGDDLGSRVIATRLVHVAMHLAHLLERRWPPYAKWFGTSFAGLPGIEALANALAAATEATDWRRREAGLAAALGVLAARQAQVGLPSLADPVAQFWDRPFLGVREEIIEGLEESICDPQVRALPRGVGSAEQHSENVDVLVHAARRRFPTP